MPPVTPEQPKNTELPPVTPEVGDVLATPETGELQGKAPEVIAATPEVMPEKPANLGAEPIVVPKTPVAQPNQVRSQPVPAPSAASGAVVSNREKVMYEHLGTIAERDPFKAVDELARWRQQELVRLGVQEEIPKVEKAA